VTRKQLVYGLVAIAIIAVAVVAYLFYTQDSPQSALPGNQVAAGVTVTPEDRTLGNPKASVVVVEYAAPTCPHCAHFDMDIFPSLKKAYIDTNKIYYIFRVFPLNPADLAAEALARCLPAENYFQFMDLLFRNQEKWDPEYGVRDVHGGLVTMGRIAGMGPDKVDECMSNKAVYARTNQVGADAESKYGVTGTPTFIINGRTHSLADLTSYEDWQKLLDSLLKAK
jgi:protein-disulfide isomerase